MSLKKNLKIPFSFSGEKRREGGNFRKFWKIRNRFWTIGQLWIKIVKGEREKKRKTGAKKLLARIFPGEGSVFHGKNAWRRVPRGRAINNAPTELYRPRRAGLRCANKPAVEITENSRLHRDLISRLRPIAFAFRARALSPLAMQPIPTKNPQT